MTTIGFMMHLTPDEGQSATQLYTQAGQVLAELEQPTVCTHLFL